MQLALHSHVFHYTIVILVVLDAIIVLTEFLLDIGALGRQLMHGCYHKIMFSFCMYMYTIPTGRVASRIKSFGGKVYARRKMFGHSHIC